MDPLLISACVGIASLVIERLFKYSRKRSHFKSSCCGDGVVIERDVSISNNLNKK